MFKHARCIVRTSVLLPLAADQLSGWKPALFSRKLYTIIMRKLIHYEENPSVVAAIYIMTWMAFYL